MAEVSKEAMQKVKSAIVTFSTDSSKCLQDLCKQASASVSQCAQSLGSIEKQKNELTATVAQQHQKVQLMHNQIERIESDIKRLQVTIPQLTKKADSLRQRIMYMNRVLSNLRSQLSNAQSDEEKAQIEKQIAETENELQDMQYELQCTEQQKETAKEDLLKNQAMQSEIKGDLNILEGELSENEHRLRILSDKFAQLQSAFTPVKDAAEGLVAASKHLQGNDTLNRSLSCLNSCIACLDEYLNTNF